MSNAVWELPNDAHDAIMNWFDSDDIVLTLCEGNRTDHFRPSRLTRLVPPPGGA